MILHTLTHIMKYAKEIVRSSRARTGTGVHSNEAISSKGGVVSIEVGL